MELNRLMNMMMTLIDQSKKSKFGISKNLLKNLEMAIKLIRQVKNNPTKEVIDQLIHVLAELAEAIPELMEDIHKIVKALKKLSKLLDPQFLNQAMMSSSQSPQQQLSIELKQFKEMLGIQAPLKPMSLDMIMHNQTQFIIENTTEEREKIGIWALELMSDKLILSEENFDMVDDMFKKINNLSRINPSDNATQLNDHRQHNKIDGVAKPSMIESSLNSASSIDTSNLA